MCTVSWLPGPGGYLLCFNRDENRARRPGLPPTRREHDGLEILAPTDADAGGTWLGVNAAGVAVGLANLYGQSAPLPADPVSRGLLVLDLLERRSLDEVAKQLSATSLDRYRPFTIIGVVPGAGARLWTWNGRTMAAGTVSEPGLLITSSAVDQAGAALSRARVFREAAAAGLSPELLTDLHRSHLPERGGQSVCMHRTDACTVSLSRVEVTTDRIAMAYAAGAPCHTRLDLPLTALRQSLRSSA